MNSQVIGIVAHCEKKEQEEFPQYYCIIWWKEKGKFSAFFSSLPFSQVNEQNVWQK